MRRNILICGLMIAFLTTVTQGQDVKMYSNTSETELLRVENTGSSPKTGINVITDGYGVHVSATNSEGVHSEGYQVGVFGKASHYNGSGILGEGNEGVFGYGNSNYEPTGVWGWANRSGADPSGSTFGVRGTAYGSEFPYGVYGEAYPDYPYSTGWAGFFDGHVYVGGYFDNPSDIMFKKNIAPMAGSLGKIMALKPKTYDMKTEEFKDKVYLPTGKQYGLIAQELETVFPELVHKTVAPGRYTKEEHKKGVKKTGTEFKSVNYQALIPILVQAVQEQQAQIEAMKAEIAALRAR